MIAGIMQPYFFPYIGSFDHISRCDAWVVLDLTQYTPQTWMNRNRMLHPRESWFYITLPVKKTSEKQPIVDVHAQKPSDTCAHLLRQLVHYKKHAPYYRQVVEIVEQAFAQARSDSLTDINVSGLSAVCAYLSISFTPVIASETDFVLPEITHPGQWALEIATLLGADVYLNPPSGRTLFRPEEFAARNIRLGFTRVPDFTYECGPYGYEPSLSILDALMWNDPQTVRSALGRAPIDYI